VDISTETNGNTSQSYQASFAMVAIGRRAEGLDDIAGQSIDLIELVLGVHVLDHAFDLERTELTLVVELVAEITSDVWCQLHDGGVMMQQRKH
jgi:hypothetical protein